MDLIRLILKGLTHSQTQSGAYALVLSDENGERRLPIIIGTFEAQSIAIAMDSDAVPPRPLTHDLFVNLAGRFHIQLKKVIIQKLLDGVFYSILVCSQDGEEKHIDARTSDAVALAVRFNAPVFTTKQILDKAGIILAQNKTSAPSSTEVSSESAEKSSSAPKSLDQLQTELNQAVADEDYERAAKIRDEIDRRNQI